MLIYHIVVHDKKHVYCASSTNSQKHAIDIAILLKRTYPECQIDTETEFVRSVEEITSDDEIIDEFERRLNCA